MDRTAAALLKTLDGLLATRGTDSPLGLAELARLLLPAWQHELERLCLEGSEPFGGVSCRRGCAACCRQPVPLSIAEACLIADLTADLPENHRTEVLDRFAGRVAELEAAGMASRALLALAHDYATLSLACPFLIDDACSIHPLRPAACREHLAVSPPALCATLGGGAELLQLPLRLLDVLGAVCAELLDTAPLQVPLIRALDWHAAAPEVGRYRWSPGTIRRAFVAVLGRDA